MKKLFLFLFVLLFTVNQAQNSKLSPQVLKPADINWEKVEKLSNGVQNYLVVGDPQKEGYYIMMVRIPNGIKLPPHFHPEDRTVVVTNGTFFYGYGDTFDEAKLNEMTIGTFFTEPSNQPHFAFAKVGDVILQVSGFGPTGSTLIKK
jgi:quercetin dioxygenase-like cupin family protein